MGIHGVQILKSWVAASKCYSLSGFLAVEVTGQTQSGNFSPGVWDRDGNRKERLHLGVVDSSQGVCIFGSHQHQLAMSTENFISLHTIPRLSAAPFHLWSLISLRSSKASKFIAEIGRDLPFQNTRPSDLVLPDVVMWCDMPLARPLSVVALCCIHEPRTQHGRRFSPPWAFLCKCLAETGEEDMFQHLSTERTQGIRSENSHVWMIHLQITCHSWWFVVVVVKSWACWAYVLHGRHGSNSCLPWRERDKLHGVPHCGSGWRLARFLLGPPVCFTN